MVSSREGAGVASVVVGVDSGLEAGVVVGGSTGIAGVAGVAAGGGGVTAADGGGVTAAGGDGVSATGVVVGLGRMKMTARRIKITKPAAMSAPGTHRGRPRGGGT
jgi:hypothetical protein